ncbi:MAG: hypothetical protein ACREQB_04740, partial [Candidatus Binataceae bacterium]
MEGKRAALRACLFTTVAAFTGVLVACVDLPTKAARAVRGIRGETEVSAPHFEATPATVRISGEPATQLGRLRFPADIHVTPPAAHVPAAAARFSGLWVTLAKDLNNDVHA